MSISLEPYAQTSFNPLGPPLLLRRIFDLGGWEKGNWGTPPNPRQEVSSCTSVRRVARAKRSLPVTRKHPETPGRDKSLAPSSVIPAELVLVKTGSGNPGKPWRRPDQGHDSSRLYGTPCNAPAGGLLHILAEQVHQFPSYPSADSGCQRSRRITIRHRTGICRYSARL